jgi:glyoxylase-like metal-dependent hydrolase (beta-lactamase superfamily II)
MIQIKSFTFNDFQENTYIIYNEKDCIVVDPGNYQESENLEIKDFIEVHNLKLNYVLLTHCHIDHILGLKYLHDNYKMDVYIPEGELEMYKSSENIAIMYGLNLYNHLDSVQPIKSNTKLNFSNSQIEILNVPGHSPDHLAYFFRGSKVCFSGDVLFKNSIGRTDLPGGNYDTLINSINNNLFTVGDDTLIYPGHGPSTLISDEKNENPFLI